MGIKVIKTEADYNNALVRMEHIFHAPENTPEADEAERTCRSRRFYKSSK